MIGQVVASISPADIEELQEIAGQMLARSAQGQSFAELDRAFHATLFRCLGNAFLLSLVDLFWQVFNRLSDHLPQSDALAQRATAQDHLAVALMVQAGDVQALERAHRHHFQEISRRLDAMYAPTALAH